MSLDRLDIENLLPEWLEQATPEDRIAVIRLLKRLIVRHERARDCSCEGWGCSFCCTSDEEIRARQGIFS